MEYKHNQTVRRLRVQLNLRNNRNSGHKFCQNAPASLSGSRSHTDNFTWLETLPLTAEFPILWLQSSQTDWFPFICPNIAEKLYFSNLGHDYPRTNQPRLSCHILSNVVVSWELIGIGGGATTQVSTMWTLFLSISDAIATFIKTTV